MPKLMTLEQLKATRNSIKMHQVSPNYREELMTGKGSCEHSRVQVIKVTVVCFYSQSAYAKFSSDNTQLPYNTL